MKRVSCYMLMLLPAFIAVLYVRTFGVNAVFGDQWEMVPHFFRFEQGRLSVLDLFGFHNEHLFFFPRLVMISLGAATDWSNVAEMYFIVACLAGSAALLFAAFRESLGEMKPLDLLAFVPVAWMVLSLRQHTNLLWGYQITFSLTHLSCVAALLLIFYLVRRDAGGFRGACLFSLAILCALVASGSSAQGLIIWPAGLLLLVLVRPVSRLSALAWSISGASVWILYLAFRPQSSDTASYAPTDFFGYFITLLGNSLVSRPGLVVLCGSALLALGVFSVALLFRASLLERGAFWVALLFFSLGTLATIAFGRAGLDPNTALASRYTTFSLLACVSVVMLLYLLWRESQSRAVAGALLLPAMLLVCASIPVSYYNGWIIGETQSSERQEAALIIREYETRPEEDFRELDSSANDMSRRISRLQKIEYNVFSDKRRPVESGNIR